MSLTDQQRKFYENTLAVTRQEMEELDRLIEEELAKVKDRLANKVDKRVFIKADARARYGNVVDVVDNVRAAGVDDVGLLTDQKKQGVTTSPPPATTGTGAGVQ